MLSHKLNLAYECIQSKLCVILAFGASPAFGSPPAFGSKPAFGATPASVFGR